MEIPGQQSTLISCRHITWQATAPLAETSAVQEHHIFPGAQSRQLSTGAREAWPSARAMSSVQQEAQRSSWPALGRPVEASKAAASAIRQPKPGCGPALQGKNAANDLRSRLLEAAADASRLAVDSGVTLMPQRQSLHLANKSAALHPGAQQILAPEGSQPELQSGAHSDHLGQNAPLEWGLSHQNRQAPASAQMLHPGPPQPSGQLARQDGLSAQGGIEQPGTSEQGRNPPDARMDGLQAETQTHVWHNPDPEPQPTAGANSAPRKPPEASNRGRKMEPVTNTQAATGSGKRRAGQERFTSDLRPQKRQAASGPSGRGRSTETELTSPSLPGDRPVRLPLSSVCCMPAILFHICLDSMASLISEKECQLTPFTAATRPGHRLSWNCLAQSFCLASFNEIEFRLQSSRGLCCHSQ